jgi:NAD(P)-dependent dehydrogenase (short-subunit alcohol dehydrogenase family)
MSNRELADQVGVVTGGGRGIGRGIVEALAEAGMSVAVLGRSEGEIETTAEAARRQGVAAVAIATDVTSRSAVERAIGEVLGRFGSIDLLVNNAGRAQAVGPPWETDPESWWADVEVNLRGTFLCARTALPAMIERGRGRIVNVATLAASMPFPYASAYASSKAAVLNLTGSLAAATEKHGLSVFAISPGLVRTSLLEGLANSAEGRRWLPEFQARPPEDYVTPEVAGRLVATLATGTADRLSGRFIHVSDDLAALIAAADDIVDNDRRVLRLAE